MIDVATNFPSSKKIILEFITDDLVGILDSMKSFITKFDSLQTAESMETKLLSIGMSISLLHKEKKSN